MLRNTNKFSAPPIRRIETKSIWINLPTPIHEKISEMYGNHYRHIYKTGVHYAHENYKGLVDPQNPTVEWMFSR